MSVHPESHEAEGQAHHNDNFRFLGREYPFPVYTGVFILLAVATIIEVLLFELPRGFLTIPVMIALALVKAGLVVWFYMHLNKDSRIFMVTLIIPTVMVILATLFLMAMPPGGY